MRDYLLDDPSDTWWNCNFTCHYCGNVLPRDDQAKDEGSFECCVTCKQEMEGDNEADA